MKKIAISCGPIPARLDSVKFLTNRFKGGLAFKTAHEMARRGYDVTVVTWKYTNVPSDIMAPEPVPEDGRGIECPGIRKVVRVNDVFEYYDWFKTHAMDFDAFIMAAAVANLTPVKPYEGKFPSHNYRPGDEFDIRFMIAPRAIDAIKPLNPRACLIGYKLFDAASDEELADIARHTLADARANIIFANTPAGAKDRKLAVMADNSVVPCSFEEHLDLIDRVIKAQYFRSDILPLTEKESENPDVRYAKAVVAMFEKTFPGYGTAAVPVNLPGFPEAFMTTSRGHKSGPALVRSVDMAAGTVLASEKATLNAPAMAAMLRKNPGCIVIHRHFSDEHAAKAPENAVSARQYLFPGTMEEAETVDGIAGYGHDFVEEPFHGYLQALPVRPVDWTRYHELFPAKYFGVPPMFQSVMDLFAGKETLEIGGNRNASGKYAYDRFVKADHAINLTWGDVMERGFDLVFARNAVNYMTPYELQQVLSRTENFIANTFLEPPDEKVTNQEAAVRNGTVIQHALRLPDDSIMTHVFYAYDRHDYEAMGLKVTPYGRNSALVTKGCGL